MKDKLKKAVSPFAIVSICITVFSVVLLVFAKLSVSFADLLNSTLCFFIRRSLAAVSDLFPFSVFELIILSSPLIILGLVLIGVKAYNKGQALRFFINFGAVLLLLYAGNILCLGISYNTTTIDKALDMPKAQVNADSLEMVMISLRDEVNSLAEEIEYASDGASVSGYSMDKISQLICESYSELSLEYGIVPDFSSRAKGAYGLGVIMSYLGITGVYTYFTGESNVNCIYPDYELVFTAAHELAHQRGVLRENEANFVAYLVCSRSDDPYLRYSAALSLYSYIGSALYRTDKQRYYTVAEGLCDEAVMDIRASSAVSEKYGKTFIADISSFINDLFLKSHGTDGVVTYGRVVTLAVSYFQMQK